MAGFLAVAIGLVTASLNANLEISEESYREGTQSLFDGDDVRALAAFDAIPASRWRQPMFYEGRAIAATKIATKASVLSAPWKPMPTLSEDKRVLINVAIQDGMKAVAISGDDATLWSNLAWDQALVHDDAAALASFERAVQVDPRDVISHVSLGLLYERQECKERAFDQYVQAVISSPRIVDSPFFVDLGQRYPAQTKIIVDLGIGGLAKLPQTPIVTASLAKLHAHQGQFELAALEYTNTLRDLPGLPYTWANLGVAENRLKKPTAAYLDFERALVLDSFNTVAGNELANRLLMRGEPNSARDLYIRQLLTPRPSVHAERTWRLYREPALDSDDILPTGLLDYLTDPGLTAPICQDIASHLPQTKHFSARAMRLLASER